MIFEVICNLKYAQVLNSPRCFQASHPAVAFVCRAVQYLFQATPRTEEGHFVLLCIYEDAGGECLSPGRKHSLKTPVCIRKIALC